jgi:hypothetical protein
MKIESKAYSIINDDFILRGGIDLLVGTTLVDWKTCSDIKEEMQKKDFSPQLDLYAIALMDEGHEVTAKKYNFIKKPTRKLKAKQTVDDYVEELLSVYNEAPSLFAASYLMPITRERLEWAAQWVTEACEDIKRSRLLNRYPQNPQNCKAFNTECKFLSLCSNQAHGRNIEHQIRTEYEAFNPGEREHGELLMSFSSASLYRACPRKFWFEHERLLRKKGSGESLALTMGREFHEEIEEVLTHDLERAEKNFYAAIALTEDRSAQQRHAQTYAMTVFAHSFFPEFKHEG